MMPAQFINDINRFGMPQFYQEEYGFIFWGWEHLGIHWCIINQFGRSYDYYRWNDNKGMKNYCYSNSATKEEWEEFMNAKKQIAQSLGEEDDTLHNI